jgi:hypothetical protein
MSAFREATMPNGLKQDLQADYLETSVNIN